MAWIKGIFSKSTPVDDYIFKGGDLKYPFTSYAYAYTGGPAARTTGTVSVVNDRLQFTLSPADKCTSFITTPIDVTNVNTIKVNIASNNTTNLLYARVGIIRTRNDNYTFLKELQVGASTGEKVFDVSDVNGTVYFVLYIASYGISTATINISEIDLV